MSPVGGGALVVETGDDNIEIANNLYYTQ